MTKSTIRNAFVGALSALLLMTPLAKAEELTLKFSHVVAESTPKGQMALKFQELVAERLAGKVKIEVYPNSQLFNDNKVLEAILLGDVHFAVPSLSKFKKYTPKLQVFDLPFLFKDRESVERFLNSDTGQALLDSMKGKGLKGLGFSQNGLKQISANSPLRVPTDAAQKKFRVMTSDVLVSQFEALDAIPLKKPFSEVFTLLQTRAIDGQENTWVNIYSKKFFEVQDYITESDHGLLAYMVVTSNDFWDDLPDGIRTELKAALDEAIEFGNELSAKQQMTDRQRVIDSGRTEVLQLTAEEKQQWIAAMKPVWGQFEDEIGKDLIDAALAANSGGS